MHPESPRLPKIAIAGATGFVGRAVHAALLKQAEVTALSRNVTSHRTADGTHWRHCDLFQLASVTQALAGCESALYLVHSMQPRTLAQGAFNDFDLLCADNFARACKAHGVKHIVYLGGIIPQEDTLSMHLQSRLEVEAALADHGVPVTTLRAALIVGAGGSSFEMMQKLVQRLPALAVPKQLRHKVQPIALADAVALLCYCLNHPELAGEHHDIGGTEVLTYAEMLRQVSQAEGSTRPVIELPIPIPWAANWVSTVSGYPLALVRPLVDSLQHDMVVGDGAQLQRRANVPGGPFAAAVHSAKQRADASPLATPMKSPGNHNATQVLAAERIPLAGAQNLHDILHSLRHFADMSVTLAGERGTFDADALREQVVDGRITLRWREGALRAVDTDNKQSSFHADLREVCGRRTLLATLHGHAESRWERAERRAQIAAFRVAVRAARAANAS